MVKRMLSLAVVLTLALTVGCSTTSSGYPKYTTMKWMAGGSAIGATIGGVWACQTQGDLNVLEGIAVGGLAGATVGGVVGNIIEEKDIKDKIASMEREIADLKAQLQAKSEALDAANRRIAELEAQIADLKKNQGGKVFEISLGSDVLFESGSARLADKGKKALDDVAGKLKSQYGGKFFMVEGHTDADPIKVSGWKSNWELGAARALTVLHYMTDKGVDPAKMSAATFSKYQPVAGNETAAGKAQNRRAVISVYKNTPNK